MKITPLALLCGSAFWAFSAPAQIIISQFSFEIVTPADASGTGTVGPFNSDFGPGTLSAVHLNSSNFTTPVGNGSANSFSANNWSSGDFFEFSLNTTGFSNLFLTFAMGRSGTGPDTFQLSYSTDGGANFSLAGSAFSVSSTAFSAATYNATFVRTYDLSSITALNSNPSAIIRLVATVAGSSAAGTARLDDFVLSSGGPITVPEPGPIAWIAGAAVVGGIVQIRRRR